MKEYVAFVKTQLVREKKEEYSAAKNPFNEPKLIYKFIKNFLDIENETVECMYLICLNHRNCVNAVQLISRGTINLTVVDVREIIRTAILTNSSSIVLTHNHPSGDCSPSLQDIELTKRLKSCSELFQIALLDHIIIGDNDYYSFKASGTLE